MRLALLKGNRFNPWHLQVFRYLRGNPSITAFRADSEIQELFRGCDDGSVNLPVERIYFDTQAGNPLARLRNAFLARYGHREPRILPFHERLRGFDLIHTWELFTDWSSEAALAREKYGIPLVVMVWDNIPFNMERDPQRLEIKRRVAAIADRFIVHTERSRRMLDMEGVEARRIVKIDHGVDTQAFSPGKPDRAGLGLADDEFVILFVGWLLPRKGLDFLLLALRELLRDPTLKSPEKVGSFLPTFSQPTVTPRLAESRKGRKLRLLVVGSGPGKDRIDQLIARLDIAPWCTVAGAVPYNDMPDVFRAADVFVLPSIATPEWQEQFGMSLMEAMACGVPVVSTYSGAIPEIVGDAGLLCQPNDFLTLYEALKRLIEDPSLRQTLAAAGRSRAVARFNLQTYADGLVDIYEALLLDKKRA